ncbi:MAG: class I SAM-dependent rRNA methyltransferase [Desulfovibrio sp.]|nr:class I SAM-dependent rRNA methyltransferase [Desulfovibrio sp.]
MNTLWLKKKEDARIKGGHLWIFSNEVDTGRSPLKAFEAGESVLVRDAGGGILGSALINPRALICARIYSRKETPFSRDILVSRLKEARSLREAIFPSPWYRLVHGEGDLLPGLIVDRYGEHMSVQIGTMGMECRRGEILDAIQTLFAPKSILFKNNIPIRALEGLSAEDVSEGTVPEELEVPENGCLYTVSLQRGQKTGWFYDQRDNRRMTARFARGASVLDAFCYAGGFGVLCAKEGAREVCFLDSSEYALKKAMENLKRNAAHCDARTFAGDALETLSVFAREGRSFDLVSIDPPAFIKHRRDSREGIACYRRLNSLAIRLVRPGGILVSSSCSFHLRAETLLDAISRGAAKEKRRAKLLYAGRQSPDHPELLGMPETSYLKCFIVRMDPS